MASKRKRVPTYAKGLAKSVSKSKRNARDGRTRKSAIRAKSRGHTGRKVADERRVSPLARLMGAFIAERVPHSLYRPNVACIEGELEETEGKMNWLPDMDLNHDKQIQSLLCYRYTIGQTSAFKVELCCRESSPSTYAAGI